MPSTSSAVISSDVPKPGPTLSTTKHCSSYHPASSESIQPAIRRVSCGVPSPSNKTNLTMRSHIHTMDPVEFDSLPPAVRRKYFSSLERLRYAQHQNGASSLPPSNHGRTMSSASGKLSKLRTKNRPSYDSFRSTTSPPRPTKPTKSNLEANAFLLSQADAKWYLELPETIRRKHFSREERILLATRCESIILDAADEAIFRRGQASRSLDTLDSFRSSPIPGFRGSACDVDAMNAVEEIRKSFRWLDEDGALDLRLGEYLCPDSDKHETDPAQPRSFVKRTHSLSSKTNRTHSSSTSSLSSPLAPAGPSLGASRRPMSHHMHTTRHQPSLSKTITSTDTDAAYYQDPEARLKLRVYLASPQKFDEAVEFGFPSTAESKGFSKTRPRAATVRKVEAEMDGLRSKENGGGCLLDEFNGAPANVGDALDYQMMMREREEQTSPAVTSPLRTSNPAALFDPYPHASPGNREMTLRMTLTRKDLRADENELYGWRKSDPLALEELPPARDSDACHFDWGNGGKGSGSGLKKLWRKVKGFR